MASIEERVQKGQAKRREIWGDFVPDYRAETADIAQEFTKLMDEVLFGEIWSRPGLETRSRSMITIAMLTVLGKESQLRTHVRGALNLGISRNQIMEILMQSAFYGGVPAALQGMRVAQEIFRDVDRAGTTGS